MKTPALFIKIFIPILSIILALAGIVQLRSGLWTAGVICIVLAVAGLTFIVRLLKKSPFTSEELETLKPILSPRFIWVIVIGLVILSVIYVADNEKSARTDHIAVAAWVCAMVLGLMITWWREIRLLFTSRFTSLREKIRVNRVELITLSLVLGMAFLLRTISLSTHPYPWSGDEGSIGIEARRILIGEVINFFETGWSSQSSWSFVPAAIAGTIFGQNIFAIRLVSALAGTLAVLFVYLTGRVLFNPMIGLMAGAFLATLPYNVHFSRIGVHNVMDSLMSSLLFWLIVKALRDDSPRYYYSAGVVAGLCIYSYTGTRLALILGVATFFFVVIRQRDYLASHWKYLVTFLFGIILSAAPQAAFFARHPDIFIGRLGLEGILFNGWLTQEAARTGQSVIDILINQFARTTIVFIASPAQGIFFNSPEPYLTIFGSILFLIGMGYSLAYVLETRHFIVLLWFWAVILFGGILTLNPPANTRMLMTTPPVAILMALGTSKVVEYLQKFRIISERMVAPIFFVVVLIITYQNINFYMGEYRTNMYFQNPNSEYAMETGLMAKDLGEDYVIYLLGSPRIFAGFPTFSFMMPKNQYADFNVDTLATLTLSPDQKVAFFAIPENRPLLEEISGKFPGGERGLIYRKPNPDEILFEYYILAP